MKSVTFGPSTASQIKAYQRETRKAFRLRILRKFVPKPVPKRRRRKRIAHQPIGTNVERARRIFWEGLAKRNALKAGGAPQTGKFPHSFNF